MKEKIIDNNRIKITRALEALIRFYYILHVVLIGCFNQYIVWIHALVKRKGQNVIRLLTFSGKNSSFESNILQFLMSMIITFWHRTFANL